MGILKAENDSLVKETAVYNVNDLFTSSDMLFQDNNISTAHNGWPAHFSTIFDDAICNGQSYTFTVETRQRQYSKDRPFVVIELQHISEDFYKYLKALEIYNLSANDIYAEPQYIPSNITNGIGIFGSLTATRHTLYF